ncbi:synaptotagmin-1-like [Dendronephthya gigantea]|uniref:synaptotagmin-1-like n=1 Tax=Dendronephthya gigantea TaxID=151771 RepID=UPI00106D8720|nr:synaptotagmin-1-like [Dendronephthya gigantea]
MATLSENELCSSAHSPSFLKQRKIAYVDNPFDEQASQSMAQKCDIKYINFPRKKNGGKQRGVSETCGQNEADKKREIDKDELWPLGHVVKGEGLSATEQDWSCLFTPVQCHMNSPAGEIQLSLSYDPWLGSLKVAIIKAKGLTCSICARKAHNSGIICVGTFVNISLSRKNKRLQTKRTEMKTRKAEIFFYEKFSFLAQKDDIRDCSLHCQAVHKVGSFIKRDHVIGEVTIGGDDGCDANGLRHWEEMLRKPKKSVTQWYYIQE